MTIEYRKGNLLDVTEGVIVHGCNAQGVMGSGVDKAIKERYPLAFKHYLQDLEDLEDNHRLGWVSYYKEYRDSPITVASCITQEYYGREYVNYAAIAKCFDRLFDPYFDPPFNHRDHDLVFYFPKIGAGLGGGDWNIIEQLINDSDPYDKFKKVCITLD